MALLTIPDYNWHSYNNRSLALKQFTSRCKILLAAYAGVFLFIQNGSYDNVLKGLVFVVWGIGILFMYSASSKFDDYLIDVENKLSRHPNIEDRQVLSNSWPTKAHQSYILGFIILGIVILAAAILMFFPRINDDNKKPPTIINNYYNNYDSCLHDTIKTIIYIHDTLPCTIGRHRILKAPKK